MWVVCFKWPLGTRGFIMLVPVLSSSVCHQQLMDSPVWSCLSLVFCLFHSHLCGLKHSPVRAEVGRNVLSSCQVKSVSLELTQMCVSVSNRRPFPHRLPWVRGLSFCSVPTPRCSQTCTTGGHGGHGQQLLHDLRMWVKSNLCCWLQRPHCIGVSWMVAEDTLLQFCLLSQVCCL